jgi:hypothetical protein
MWADYHSLPRKAGRSGAISTSGVDDQGLKNAQLVLSHREGTTHHGYARASAHLLSSLNTLE